MIWKLGDSFHHSCNSPRISTRVPGCRISLNSSPDRVCVPLATAGGSAIASGLLRLCRIPCKYSYQTSRVPITVAITILPLVTPPGHLQPLRASCLRGPRAALLLVNSFCSKRERKKKKKKKRGKLAAGWLGGYKRSLGLRAEGVFGCWRGAETNEEKERENISSSQVLFFIKIKWRRRILEKKSKRFVKFL